MRSLPVSNSYLGVGAFCLGVPAFEPPDPLEHPVTTRVAALLDALIGFKNAAATATALDVATLKFIVNYVFGKTPLYHAGSVKQAGVVNQMIDYLRGETGKAFPPSAEDGGTWNYDAIVGKALKDANITRQEDKDDFIGWMLLNKLQPTSAWVQGCDETKGHLGDNFRRFLRNFINDFRDQENKHRERSVETTTEDGDTVDFFDTYGGESFPGEHKTTDAETMEDIRKIVYKFREFLAEKGSRYHSDAQSLVKIFDLLLSGHRPTDIKDILGLTAGPYQVRYAKIFAAGQDFKRAYPEYASVIAPLLD